MEWWWFKIEGYLLITTICCRSRNFKDLLTRLAIKIGLTAALKLIDADILIYFEVA